MVKYFVLFSFACSSTFALFNDLESGPRPEGMAGSYTALADDGLALRFNPAGLYQLDHSQIYSFYKSIFSGLGVNLNSVNLNFALPTKIGGFGLSLFQTGFSNYREFTLTVGQGFSVLRDYGLGYAISGYVLNIRDFGTGYALGIDFGFLAKIYKRWRTGFFVKNINMPKIGQEEITRLPRLLNFGIGYSPTIGINSTFDISQEFGKATRISLGQEFVIIDNLLTIRAGLKSEPVQFACGLRFALKNIQVDYAVTLHSELPLTHNIGIGAEF